MHHKRRWNSYQRAIGLKKYLNKHTNRNQRPYLPPLHHSSYSQCPFTQMTDTDIALLPNYNNMDRVRSQVMIHTSLKGLAPHPWTIAQSTGQALKLR